VIFKQKGMEEISKQLQESLDRDLGSPQIEATVEGGATASSSFPIALAGTLDDLSTSLTNDSDEEAAFKGGARWVLNQR